MTKWRKWAKLDKPPEAVDPLPGFAWLPVVIDVYGTKLKVLQHTRIDQPLQKGSVKCT